MGIFGWPRDMGDEKSRVKVEMERAEIRRLSEQRRALREVERLMRNGRPVPPLLREKALGK